MSSDTKYPSIPDITITNQGIQSSLLYPSKTAGPGELKPHLSEIELAVEIVAILCLIYQTSI